MFLHGGWLHLIGNMWFLWIFGDNVEDTLGSFRFLLFYLVCGLAAGATHYGSRPPPPCPRSEQAARSRGSWAPTRSVPGSRVLTLVPLGFFLRLVELPAWVMLGLWFLLQAVSGSMTLGAAGGGVAWWAHVGGSSPASFCAAPRAEARRSVGLRSYGESPLSTHFWVTHE